MHLNMSIENASMVYPSSKNSRPRPIHGFPILLTVFFFPLRVSTNVDIHNGCKTAKKNHNEKSNSKPNWERNSSSVPPISNCINTCTAQCTI